MNRHWLSASLVSGHCRITHRRVSYGRTEVKDPESLVRPQVYVQLLPSAGERFSWTALRVDDGLAFQS